MKRPLTSRADLIYALASDDLTLTTAMAELLAYESVPMLPLSPTQESASREPREGAQENADTLTD